MSDIRTSRGTPKKFGVAATVTRAALAALVLAVAAVVPPSAVGPAAYAAPGPAEPSRNEPVDGGTTDTPGDDQAGTGSADGRTADTVAGRVDAATAHLRRHMAQTRTPGLGYAIVQHGRVLASDAWGVDGDGQPVSVDTPFLLGSVSKSFTALAVMQLVESGRVDLDAPARRYVPWLRLGDESLAARITVRQLLTHTTGLPQIVAMGLTDRGDNTPDGLARSVRDLATVRPTAEPGGVHQYSNANYQILGVLVEEVTGESYGGYLRRNVLDPLDMRRSVATGAEVAAVGGLPPGHRYHFGYPRRADQPYDGSGVAYGYLAASVTDLTHYALAQLDDGRYGDRQILSASGVTTSHTGQAGTGGTGRYAFGWRDDVLTETGDRIVWHGGATTNHHGAIMLVPDAELAVVVVGNSYSLAMDWPLISAVFSVTRILRGGTPVVAEADPLFGRILAGLVAVAVLLLALLAWSLFRLLRLVRLVRRRHPIRRPGPVRVVGVTLGWLVGCVAVALGAGWLVPAGWDGAGLAQVLLFGPDIGHTIIAVVGLAGALALVRLSLGGYALATARRTSP